MTPDEALQHPWIQEVVQTKNCIYNSHTYLIFCIYDNENNLDLREIKTKCIVIMDLIKFIF